MIYEVLVASRAACKRSIHRVNQLQSDRDTVGQTSPDAFEGSLDANVGCPYERELTILLGQKHESGTEQTNTGAWSGRWHNVC